MRAGKEFPVRTLHRTPAPALAALLLAVAACMSPPLAENQVAGEAATIGQPYDPASRGLGPGDTVHVTVFGHRELSSPDLGTKIDPEGYLSLPLIDPVLVRGLSPRQAADAIRTELAEYIKDPNVTVVPLEQVSQKFYVFGQVRQPGAYVLDRPLNALQGLAIAGGTMQGADRETVCLLREHEGFVEVHLFNAATPGSEGLVALRPGDFVFVRQSDSGAFREQVLPILLGVQPLLSSMVNLGLVADAIND